MTLQIVEMNQDHTGQIALIEQSCFSVPWSLNMICEELLNPAAVYLVALADGKTAGYAGMHVVLDQGYITNIAVAPGFRRQGIGLRLLQALTERGRRGGLEELTLEVRESNTAAQALYAKLGFAIVGRRRDYYTLPREDALLMTLFLDSRGKVLTDEDSGSGKLL